MTISALPECFTMALDSPYPKRVMFTKPYVKRGIWHYTLIDCADGYPLFEQEDVAVLNAWLEQGGYRQLPDGTWERQP